MFECGREEFSLTSPICQVRQRWARLVRPRTLPSFQIIDSLVQRTSSGFPQASKFMGTLKHVKLSAQEEPVHDEHRDSDAVALAQVRPGEDAAYLDHYDAYVKTLHNKVRRDEAVLNVSQIVYVG